MSITVPTTFDTSDLTLPGGIGAGEGVANASQVVGDGDLGELCEASEKKLVRGLPFVQSAMLR